MTKKITPKYEPQNYYRLITKVDLKNGKPPIEEISIAYYYWNPDAKCYGFGFNIADGSGFVPDYDLIKNTKITRLKLIDA